MRATPHALLILATLTAGLVACNESGFTDHTAPDPERPIIKVYPESLDFGPLSGGEELIKEFQVTNEGIAVLDVTEMSVRGNEASYRIVDNNAFSLQPGSSAIIKVAFSPMGANTLIGSIDISNNDEVTGTVEVGLRAEGLVPELEIDPWDYNYGSALIGCEESLKVTLSNVGTEDLVIDDLQYGGSDTTMDLAWGPSLPIVLAPGDATDVGLAYAPMDEVESDGFLTVVSNDPRGPLDADQVGDGVYDDQLTDEFEMPIAPPVDILFAVDQSCSMEDDATRLATNFGGFIDQIDSVTTGWRVGVATANNGCFNGGMLDRSTPGYKDRFRSAVLTWNGGSYTEALLTLAKIAMQNSKSGCNAGFLRADAATHIILVSDEPEQSSQSWSTLVEDLRNLHPTDRRLVKISAVAGDYPGGCGTALAGNGYWQAVQETGGEFLSICDTNWARHVERLAKASIEGLGRFDLTETPDPRTVKVWVDGVEWPSDWHIDGATIIFDVTPPEGAAVRVTYNNLACH